MKKKFAAIILVVSVLLSLVACGPTGGEGGYITNDPETLSQFMNLEGLPIVKDGQKAKLRIFVALNANAEDPDDMRWTKYVEEKTGIDIEWEFCSESIASEKIRLMLAGGEDMPDIIMNSINKKEVVQYMDEGLFRPIDDLIDSYMPNLKAVYDARPQYRTDSIAPDGHIYGVPYVEEMNGLGMSPGPIYIYKPWLDALGMELPDTLAEYRTFLEKVKVTDLNKNGKNDEIPFTFQYGGYDSYEGYHWIVSCFGINDNFAHLSVKDGKVINTATQPGFRDAMEYVHQMYKDGLIDKESFAAPMSGDPRARVLAKINAEKPIVASVQLFDPMGEITISEERRSEYVPLPRLTGPNGDKSGIHYNQTEMTSATRCIITTSCQYPELAARFIDFCFDPAESVLLNWGTEGYVYVKDANGVLRWDMTASGKPALKEGYESINEMRWASTPVYGGLAILNDYYETVVEFPLDAQLILAGQRAAGSEEYLAELEFLPNLWYTQEEMEILAQNEIYVNNLVNSYVTTWMQEGGATAQWEQFLGELKAANIDAVLGAYQSAYDRYLQQQAG